MTLASTDPELVSDQRALFTILDEFFERATGTKAAAFAPDGDVPAAIRANASAIGTRGKDAFTWGVDALGDYYRVQGMRAFKAARTLGGAKLVLGGGSAFTQSQFDGVRKMALYADTLLIPDPILPWIEDSREHEGFQRARLLEAVAWTAQLKPLIDVDLPYPAVVIFPSYEKSLERGDPVTQAGLDTLISSVVSRELAPYLDGRIFDSIDDLWSFAAQSPDSFLAGVDAAGLFLPPGGDGSVPLTGALDEQREYVAKWRTGDYKAKALQLPDAQLALMGIMERLTPHYHLLENAEELRAQPMLTVEAQWAYYQRVAKNLAGRLVEQGLLGPKTIAALRALQQPELQWLGNVPVPALARLRSENANEAFRRTIDEHFSALYAAALDDLDRVAAEVARALASLLAEHQREVSRISDAYARKHSGTTAAALVTAAAWFVPALAPYRDAIGATAPVALAGKFFNDRREELAERKAAAQSLAGVLAAAQTPRRTAFDWLSGL